MKVILNIIIFLSLLLTIGCNRFFNSNDEPEFINGIEITDTIDFGDNYTFDIGFCATPPLSYAIFFNQDTLSVSLYYSGGCQFHSFKTQGFFEQNNLILWLNHNSNNDQCKASINEFIKQDMTNIDFDSLFILNPMDSSRLYIY